jgi:putative glycosyltransferase (TIGR04372 family)
MFIKIMENVINFFLKKNFYYILFDSSTSIGVASEIIRLNLIKAKNKNKNITLIKINTPFKSYLSKYKYPAEIYKIKSENIRDEYYLIKFLLSYYYGFKKILISLFLSILKGRRCVYLLKEVNAFDVHNENININKYSEFKKLKKIFDRPSLGFISRDKFLSCHKIRMNMEIDKKYVCLHIRSSQFYNDSSDYRNSSPESYYKMINHLIDSGFIVIRLGDTGNIMQGYKREGFIDYPNTNYKSEMMDLYLIQECYFYIGTLSGILDTAYLFGKDVVCVNSLDFDSRSQNSKDITIYKHIFSKDKNRVLSIEESIEEYSDVLKYRLQKYKYIENNENEILQSVEEMIEKKNDIIYKYSNYIKKKIIRKKLNLHKKNGKQKTYFMYSIIFSNEHVLYSPINTNRD